MQGDDGAGGGGPHPPAQLAVAGRHDVAAVADFEHFGDLRRLQRQRQVRRQVPAVGGVHEHDQLGRFALDRLQQQPGVRLGVIVADLGGVGQIEGAVEGGQLPVAADQKQGGFGADGAGEGHRLVGAAEQLAVAVFAYQQCFHGVSPS